MKNKSVISVLICISMICSVCGGSVSAFAQYQTQKVELKAEAPEGLVEALKFAPPVVDTTNVGYGIQRTMRLLETSTQESPNTVRIAFCGQSITDANNNSWPAAIMAYIRAKYPTANVLSQNFGIGGYNTYLMKDIYQNDISSFYPDLVFFYDYGDIGMYRSIVRWIRDNTVAEVIVQGQHIDKGSYGSDDYSYNKLPVVASDLACEYADVRTYWKKYLDDNKLDAVEMLVDKEVHLNDQGQALMFEILKQYLVYKPVDEAFDDQVTTLVSGKDFQWKNGVAEIPFIGNRVEIISPNEGAGAKANVLINKKKPSSFLQLYNNTRYANLANHVYASYFRQIQFLKPVVPQKWTMEFQSETEYILTGEISGNQGTGDISSEFITADGSMAFYPAFWYKGVGGVGAPYAGYYLEFNTTLNGADSVEFKGVETVASNLPKLNNSLKLTCTEGTAPSISVRVYKPRFLYNAPQVDEVKAGDSKVTGTAKPDSLAWVEIGDTYHSADVDAEGKFTVELPKIGGNKTVDVFFVYDSHKSQVKRFTTGEGAVVKPALFKVSGGLSVSSKVVKGKASEFAEILIKNGGKVFIGAADKSGKFSVKVNKLVAGKLSVIASANGLNTKAKKLIVAPLAPTKVKASKKGMVIGKASSNAGICIYNGVGGKLLGKCKAAKNGKFSKKLKLKSVKKVKLVAVVNNAKSKPVVVKVK